MKLRVSYADVAVGAKENFAPSATGQTSNSTPALLQGQQTPMYANPCEIYSVLLDGSLMVPPDDPKYALVSDSLSSATDGSFETPLVLTLTATGQYTSQGITLVFDETSNRYATAVNIKWYRGSALLSDKNFTPDKPNFFCANKIENYNKLIISFSKMNMPRNRLYLTDILYGTVRNFGKDEIENFSLLQEIEPVSETISINTVGFTLKKQSDVDFIFQEKQPVYTYFDDTLVQKYPTLAVTFVDNHDSQRGSSLESQVKSWFKPLAYGLILLMKEGYPCVFYGDYYSMKGEGSPHRPILDILLDARRSRAFGEQTDYFDHPNTVGFTRSGDAQHPDSGLALLLSNGEDGEKVMSVGVMHANETWHEITGSYDDELTIGDDGKALFKVHGGKLAVWVRKKD